MKQCVVNRYMVTSVLEQLLTCEAWHGCFAPSGSLIFGYEIEWGHCLVCQAPRRDVKTQYLLGRAPSIFSCNS